jgi:hypothetical protein
MSASSAAGSAPARSPPFAFSREATMSSASSWRSSSSVPSACLCFVLFAGLAADVEGREELDAHAALLLDDPEGGLLPSLWRPDELFSSSSSTPARKPYTPPRHAVPPSPGDAEYVDEDDDYAPADDGGALEPTPSICEHTCLLPIFVDPRGDEAPTGVPGFVFDPPQLHCHWAGCGAWHLPARGIKAHLSAHACAALACAWAGCAVVPFKASAHLHRHVLENHGRTSRVRCVRCGQRFARTHARLAEHRCRPEKRKEPRNRRPMIRDQTRSTQDEPMAPPAYPAVTFV